MSGDRAEFELELVDSASDSADKISGSADKLSSSLDRIGSKTIGVSAASSKMDKAIGAVQFASYAAQALYYGKQLFDTRHSLGGVGEAGKGVARAVSGIDLKPAIKGAKQFASRAGAALKDFGRNVGAAAKRVAPFAVGGAGLYGLAHIASSVAVPALGAVAVGIGGIAIAAVGAALAVGGRAAALGAVGLKATAEFAVFGQSSKYALQQLGKYGATGEKLFAHATGLAVQFGMDVQDTTKSFQKLLAAQFNPKLATDIIKMGADLRSIGGSAEEVKGAVRAITQIKGTGRLMGDELNQLAEAGVSIDLVRRELGKLLGKGGKQLTNLEVVKLQEAGKIDADTAIQGILNAVLRKTGGKELGEAGKGWADSTIAGMAGRIKARGQLLLVGLGDRLAPSLQRLSSGVLDKLEGFLSSSQGAAMIDQIGGAFDVMGDAASAILPLITAFGSGFLETAGKMLSSVVGAIGGIGPPGEQAVWIARELGSGLAKIIGYGGAAVGALTAIAGVGAAMMGSLVALPPLLLTLGGDLMIGLAKGITKLAWAPIDAIVSVGKSVIGAAKGIFDSHSPSRVFTGIGYSLPQGQARGMLAGTGLVVGAATSLGLATIRASELSYGPLTSAAQGISLAASPGAVSGAGLSVQITQYITIEGGSGSADEIADASQRAARREFEALMRQFEMET